MERRRYHSDKDFHKDTLKEVSVSMMLIRDERVPNETRAHHRNKVRLQRQSKDPIVKLVAMEVPLLPEEQFIGLLGQLFPVFFRNGKK